MNLIYFFISESLIIVPFIIGVLIKNKFLLNETEKKALSEKILKINLIFLEPFIIIWFIGKLNFSFSTLYLPLAGLFLVFLGFFIGYSVSYKLSNRNHITLTINLSLANHGYTMGGITCYFIFGDEGLSKALIFISYFYFYLYGFLFPWIQKKQNQISNNHLSIRNKFLDYRLFPLYGLIIGLMIFSFRIPLPNLKIFSYIIEAMVYISIIIYYLSLGINLEIANVLKWNSILCKTLLIKFLMIPLITSVILLFIPNSFLSLFDKKIIFTMSFMPGAVYSIVSSIIFNLNIKLTVQIFVWTTVIFLTIILPLLYLIFKVYLVF